MKTIIILVLVVTLFTGCKETDIGISKIIIRDNNFNTLQSINQEKPINKFKIHWLVKEQVELKKEPNFTYKIDIISDGKSTRWLYDSSGYTTILNKAETPTYQIKEVDKFNNLIIP